MKTNNKEVNIIDRKSKQIQSDLQDRLYIQFYQ